MDSLEEIKSRIEAAAQFVLMVTSSVQENWTQIADQLKEHVFEKSAMSR